MECLECVVYRQLLETLCAFGIAPHLDYAARGNGSLWARHQARGKFDSALTQPQRSHVAKFGGVMLRSRCAAILLEHRRSYYQPVKAITS
ncbi:MAG: hypothetical protein ACYTXA_18990 [Nostoc sp.]